MKLLFWIALSFLPGVISSRFKPGAWYEQLPKAPWTPPNIAFPIVWTCLYAAMGTAAWLVFRDGIGTRRSALVLFLIQLVLNGLWSWIFFGEHRVGWALVDLSLLWITVAVTMVLFWNASPLAGSLMAAYLVWLTIALSLNGFIAIRT